MAKIQTGAFITNISGSIGGTTFQRNGSGLIARTRSIPARGKTEKQSVTQSQHAQMIAGWQKLTLTEKTAWNLYASGHTHTNSFGQTKRINGQNFFEVVNLNRQKLSLSILTAPPPHTLPIAVSRITLTYVLGVSIGAIPFTALGPDDECVLWVTAATTRASSSLRQLMKFAGVIPYTVGVNQNLTAKWEIATGLLFADTATHIYENIWLGFQTINKTSGLSSVIFWRSQPIVGAGSGIGSMQIENTFVVG